MRKTAGIVSLALIGLLLACSVQALAAAKQALDLWWNAVIPSLFPFFVLVGLLQDSGLLDALHRLAIRLFPRCARMCVWLPSFFLGALSGFPTGARVSGMLKRADLAAYCNLCSPIFMLGVVSVNLAKDICFFFPICIAHYSSALLCFGISLLRRDRFVMARTSSRIGAETGAQDGFLACIAEGAVAMLRIGGCIVFFSVLCALFTEIGLLPFIARLFETVGADRAVVMAMLKSILEMTTGCMEIAALTISNRAEAAMYAACVSFGGICILAQACMVAEIKQPWRYLLAKAVQAMLAGHIAFWIAPFFLPDGIPVMQLPDKSMLIQNTASCLTLLAASLTGVFGAYVICICLHQLTKRKNRGSLPGQTNSSQ